MPIPFRLINGHVLNFPDGTSKEGIYKYIDKEYPRTGAYIASAVANNPEYSADIPYKDYKELRRWKSSNPDPKKGLLEYAGIGAEALAHMGGELAGGAWAAAKAPFVSADEGIRVAKGAIEGVTMGAADIGFIAWKILASGKSAPDTYEEFLAGEEGAVPYWRSHPAAQLVTALGGKSKRKDSPEARAEYDALLKKDHDAFKLSYYHENKSARWAEGKEGIFFKDYSAEAAKAGRWVDPLTIGTLGYGGAATGTAKAGASVTRPLSGVAGKALESTGKALTGVGSKIEGAGEAVASALEKASAQTGVTPGLVKGATTGGAAVGLGAGAPLATVGFVAGGVGAVAATPPVLKAAGSLISGAGRTVGKAPVAGGGRLEQLSMDMGVHERIRQAARFGHDIGLSTAGRYAGAAAKGAVPGLGMGGALGYAAESQGAALRDPWETAAMGAGIGVGFGSLFGFGYEAHKSYKGVTAQEQSARMLGEWMAEKEATGELHLYTEMMNMSPEVLTKAALLERILNGVAFEGKGDAKIMAVTTKALRTIDPESAGATGSFMGRGHDGSPTIYIDAEAGHQRGGKLRPDRTLFHEVGHALDELNFAKDLKTELDTRLFGQVIKDDQGNVVKVVKEGILSADDIEAMHKQHESLSGQRMSDADIMKEIRAETWANMLSGESLPTLTNQPLWRRLADAHLMKETDTKLKAIANMFAPAEFGESSVLFKRADGSEFSNTKEVNALLRQILRAKRTMTKEVLHGDSSKRGTAFTRKDLVGKDHAKFVEAFKDSDIYARHEDGSIKYMDGVPVLMTKTELKRLAKRRGEMIQEALGLDPKTRRFSPLTMDDRALRYIDSPDERGFYRATWMGDYLSPEQIAALEALPRDVLTLKKLETIKYLNENAKRGDGKSLNMTYDSALGKGGKYESMSTEFKQGSILNLELSKAGQLLVRTLDIPTLMQRYEYLSGKHPKILEPWGGSGRVAHDAFWSGFTTYLANHKAGKPGHTNLHASEVMAKRMRNVYNEMVGWRRGEGGREANPYYAQRLLPEKLNPLKSRRIDRIASVEESPFEGSRYPVNKEFQSANYMAAEKGAAARKYKPRTMEETKAADKAEGMGRSPILAVAAVRLKNKEIKNKTYTDLVDAIDPWVIKGAKGAWEGIEKGRENVVTWLSDNKKPKANLPVEAGKLVEGRIDIDAYNRSLAAYLADPLHTDKPFHIITIHEPTNAKGSVGETLSYQPIAEFSPISATEGIKFMVRSESSLPHSLRIAMGASKFPLATIRGNYKAITKLPRDINNPNVWAEAGYNPVRSSEVIDVRTKTPIIGTEAKGGRAISVGSRIFVKKPIYDSQPRYGQPRLDAEGQRAGRTDTRYMPSEKGDMPFQISTRNPTAVNAPESPIKSNLVVGLGKIVENPAMLKSHALALQEYPGIKSKSRSPAVMVEDFLNHVVDNLLYLHDAVPAKIRGRSKLWYDGARAITEAWSKEYGVDRQGVAGVLAALSPQKDWFMNVDLAGRLLRIMGEQKSTKFNKEMAARYVERMGGGDKAKTIVARKEVKRMLGKTLTQQDLYGKAVFVRMFDEVYSSRDYKVVAPEGTPMGTALKADGTPAMVAWGSFTEIQKAISVVLDSSKENISAVLGEAHKIRNFFNNILLPKMDLTSVTIDTHAVAAALLRPLAGNDLEVANNFGSKPKGARRSIKSSKATGVRGTYGIYAEGYRRAAEKRGILPREMQSITWEAVRGLFEAKWKTAGNKKSVDNLWKLYENKKRNVSETRQAIIDTAGGITPPQWASRVGAIDVGHVEAGRSSPHAKELAMGDVHGQRLRSDTGRGRADTGEVPSRVSYMPEEASTVPHKPSEPFYSRTAELATDPKIWGAQTPKPWAGHKAQESVPGKHILRHVKNKAKGMSRELEWEMKWMGLEEFLKSKPKFTQAEVKAFIEAPENTVRVKEVHRGQRLDPKDDAAYRQARKEEEAAFVEVKTLKETSFHRELADLLVPRAEKKYHAARHRRRRLEPKPTKHDSYSLAGGEEGTQFEITFAIEREGTRFTSDETKWFPKSEVRDWQVFSNQSHFPEKDYFVHVRGDRRVDADGKNSIMIYELQDDYHKSVRSRGVMKTPEEIRAIESEIQRLHTEKEKLDVGKDIPEWMTPEAREGLASLGGRDPSARPSATAPEYARSYEIDQRMETLRQELIEARQGAPFLPFQENASFKYAIKAMIRKAAEMGDVERIHFIKGKESGEIYNLRNHLDAIVFEKVDMKVGSVGGNLPAEYKVGYHRKGSGWKPWSDAEETAYQAVKEESDALHDQVKQWENNRRKELAEEWKRERRERLGDKPIELEEVAPFLKEWDAIAAKESPNSIVYAAWEASLERLSEIKSRRPVSETPDHQKTYTPKELKEDYGKGLANEITRRADAEGSGFIHREGLEIGGEAHIETYDVRVPAIIDKIVKPWGERARSGKVDAGGKLSREHKEFRELQESFDMSVRNVLDDPRTPHERSRVDRYWELSELLEAESMMEGSLSLDKPAPTTYIDITPEMQKGVLYSPQSLFMPAEKIGKSTIHANGHGYKLMETVKGNWRVYAPSGILLGVSASREASKLLFERHLLKEMRRRRK